MSEESTTTIFDEEVDCPKCKARLHVIGERERTSPKPPPATFKIKSRVEIMLLPTKHTHPATPGKAPKKAAKKAPKEAGRKVKRASCIRK